MDDDFRRAALDYHRLPRPGKLAIEVPKRMANQRDLALAYSPGVAAACEAIVDDPDNARLYTARGNLVGLVSNGTAVLGLGNIGALAGKPVMEGKAVLFKKFAGIDVFDIEVDAADPARFCAVVAAISRRVLIPCSRAGRSSPTQCVATMMPATNPQDDRPGRRIPPSSARLPPPGLLPV